MYPRNRAKYRRRNVKFARGGILLSVLAFVVVTMVITAGIARLAVSHMELAQVQSDYATALDLAEAGVNYEIRAISQNASSADMPGSTTPKGTLYTFGSGTFRVYCTERDGVTAWKAGDSLIVFSTGTIHGISRSIKVNAKPYFSSSGNYVLFGLNTSIINNTASIVSGDVGTNSQFTFNNHPSILGNVIFNGSGSGWQSVPNGVQYNVLYKTSAVVWPTVTNIALGLYPPAQYPNGGGLGYLASNNDNLLASPQITSQNLLINSGTQVFNGKAGGANYYLTSLTCNGNSSISFNNSAGPITIWVGAAGNSSTFIFNGGTAAVKMSTDPSKAVRIYVATTNDVIQNGNTELDAGIYNVNGYNSGRVILNGNPTVYGSIISNMFTLNGTASVGYVAGYFQSGLPDYYGFDFNWTDLNATY